ncbi:MAG: hypothetical protein V3571_02915 [Pseudodesulfovibrio sp.]
MPFVASWSFPPAKGGVNIVNAGIDAFFLANGFGRGHCLRFQACIEGVCNYCAGNLRSQGEAEEVHVRLYWEDRSLRGLVYHFGPGGEWDHALDARQKGRIRRTSFDALGLFIAHELAADLVCRSQYDVVAGRTVREYEIVYELDGEPGVEAGPA